MSPFFYFTVKRNVLTPEEDNLLQAVKHEGLQPGLNPLHDYMQWFSHNGICDLFSAQVPDLMHTLYRAVASLIYHFSWNSMACLSQLDDQLINSHYQQSVNPFSKKSKFRQGIILP